MLRSHLCFPFHLLSNSQTICICLNKKNTWWYLIKYACFFSSNNHKATVTTDSVNYQRSRTKQDLFLLYLNEVRSNVRRTTIVRETSVISPLTVLLFKPNELIPIDANENVFLQLKGTKLKFSCTKR